MTTRTINRNSVEYLSVEITADVELDSQPVEISFDQTTWLAADWVGEAGMTRSARVLVEDEDLPGTGRENTQVYVRITDSPEIPVLTAGELRIR